MNILFVGPIPFNPAFGGRERVTDTLAKELIHRGHSVFYFVYKTSDRQILDYPFPAKMVYHPKDENLKSNYLDFIRNNNIAIIINHACDSLDSKFAIDIEDDNIIRISILCNEPDYPIKVYGRSLHLFRKQRPVDKALDVVKLFGYPFFLIRKRVQIKHLYATHYNFVFSHSDRIVGLSEGFRNRLHKFLPFPDSKFVAISNPNSFDVCQIKHFQKENEVIFVGRLSKDKNVERLLLIWMKLCEEHRDWNLTIVGDGNQRNNLEVMAKNKHLKRVSFVGRIANVEPFYKRASIICLTSQSEGFGLVLIEAMNFGCIPFAFDNYASITDIIDNGINGVLIDAYKLDKYASCMHELMKNKEKRERMALEAQRKSSLFSKENIVDQWEQLFESLRNQKKTISNCL